MTSLFLLLNVVTALASTTTVRCQWALEDLPEVEVRKVIRRVELTQDNLGLAYEEFMTGVAGMTVFNSLSPARRAGLARTYVMAFSEITSQIVMGNTEIVRPVATELARRLSFALGTPIPPDLLLDQLVQLSKSFEVVFTMGQFASANYPSVEAAALSLALEHAERVLPRARVGPREIEVVKAALQYGGTRGPVKILEVGPGSPGVPLLLQQFTGKRVVTVRPVETTPELATWFDRHHVEVAAGTIMDLNLIGRLSTDGPFRAVIAHNVPELVAPSSDRVAREALTNLGDLMPIGAILVLVNDGMRTPAFSPEFAEFAGFQVVRWGDVREIPAEWLPLKPDGLPLENAERVSTVVLRYGPSDRVRARGDLLELDLDQLRRRRH